LDLIDDVIKDMNSHLYEFNKFTTAGLTLVEGVNTVELFDTIPASTDGSPAGLGATNIVPFRESIAYVVKTSDSTRLPLTYIPWARFSEKLGNQLYSNSDLPELYSFRNIDYDGTVTLWPTPNSAAATDHTLTVEAYRRIPLYSEVGDTESIPVPEEVETALLYGACKRLAIHLYGPGHEDVAAFDTLESEAIDKLKGIDKRHPDQQQRFINVDHTKRASRVAGRRALYIKV
jgi:hypothetical protein